MAYGEAGCWKRLDGLWRLNSFGLAKSFFSSAKWSFCLWTSCQQGGLSGPSKGRVAVFCRKMEAYGAGVFDLIGQVSHGLCQVAHVLDVGQVSHDLFQVAHVLDEGQVAHVLCLASNAETSVGLRACAVALACSGRTCARAVFPIAMNSPGYITRA